MEIFDNEGFLNQFQRETCAHARVTSHRSATEPAEKGLGSTAAPTAQWRSNLSPPIVSPKTGISTIGAGDFRRILVKVADFEVRGD